MLYGKRVLTTVFFLLILSMLFSVPVSMKTAEQVALNWMSYESGRDVDNIVIENIVPTEFKGNNVLYTFTFKGGGFAIISGDDQAYPVLGFDTESKADINDMPIQMNEWVEQYSQEINQIRVDNLTDKDAELEWENILKKDFTAYETERYQYGPFISAKWHQNNSWNDYCPYDSDGPGNNAYAGCVAVSMAQIMKTWNYPSYGARNHGYYSDYGWTYANFFQYYYFNQMSNTYANHYSRTLLYHCGVSVDMGYGPDGSGAVTSKAVYALENYFRYSTSATYRLKSSYSNSVWEAIIRSDLVNGRPLIYAGGGHAFNLDGAKTYDYFHFNFGWSGWWNGWFKLSSIKPAYGWYNFTSNQKGIFAIIPLSRDEEGAETVENEIPQIMNLAQNYPNPFNPETTISFSTTESTKNTEITIYNTKGQKINTLVSEIFPEGEHNVVWNGTDKAGNKVTSGIYYYKMTNGEFSEMKKMILMK